MFVLTGRYNNIMKGKAIILLFACKNALLASLSMKIIFFLFLPGPGGLNYRKMKEKKKGPPILYFLINGPSMVGLSLSRDYCPLGVGYSFISGLHSSGKQNKNNKNNKIVNRKKGFLKSQTSNIP